MNPIVPIGAGRCYLLGDLHGQGDAALKVMQATGLCDAEGHWIAPSGTILLQVGDLIDCGRSTLRPDAESLQAVLADTPSGVRAPGLAAAEPVALQAVARGDDGQPSARQTEEQAALLGAHKGLRTLRLLMRLQTEAAAAGAEVICLMGNHELDLLRGRFDYMPRQKAFLLALCGEPPAEIERHRSDGLLAKHFLESGSPELRWLASLPFLAVGAGLVAVHGGPTSDLIESLDTLGIVTLDGLGQTLEAARASKEGFDHPLFTEGRSIFSPDRPDDDAAVRPRLASRFLALAGAEQGVLAVGHSPFLHFPRRRWQDLANPEVLERVNHPGFVGQHGQVLKLDTNLKRGGQAWLIWADEQTGQWQAKADDGRSLDLHRPRPEQAAGVERGLQAARSPGVDWDQLQQTRGAIEALALIRGETTRNRLDQALNRLLFYGLVDLAPVMLAALHTRSEDAPQLLRLEALVEAAHERMTLLAERLEAALDAGASQFLPAPDELLVNGLPLHLAPTVVMKVLERRASAGLSVSDVETLRYYGPGGKPEAHLELLSPPPPKDRASTDPQVEEEAKDTGKHRAGAEISDPALREALLALAGMDQQARCHLQLDRDGSPRPDQDRYLLRERDRDLVVLRLPDGRLMPANAAFTDPATRFPVPGAKDHAHWLLEQLEGEPVVLFAAVHEEVAWLLRLGEVESMGVERGPHWRQGRYLFTSPNPDLLDYFFHKHQQLRFELPRTALEEAVEAGLLNLNLFLSDRGETLDPTAAFGAPDIGLEVVALGVSGIQWLCRYLQSDGATAPC